MENPPRIIYLQNQKTENYAFYNAWLWKVIDDQKNECCHVIFVTKDEIEIEKKDDFFDAVSFIKNTLCKDNIGSDGCEEITRQEFDDFFALTVSKINMLSKI